MKKTIIMIAVIAAAIPLYAAGEGLILTQPKNSPVDSGASNDPIRAEVAARQVLPDGLYPMQLRRIADDLFYLPARLMAAVQIYSNNTPAAQTWPPVLVQDKLFVAANDCARSVDGGNIEVVTLAGKRVCRVIKTEHDIGAKTYSVFRYGFETGQTVLFGVRTQGCEPYGVPGDDRYDECVKKFHDLERVKKTADAIVRKLLRLS